MDFDKTFAGIAVALFEVETADHAASAGVLNSLLISIDYLLLHLKNLLDGILKPFYEEI